MPIEGYRRVTEKEMIASGVKPANCISRSWNKLSSAKQNIIIVLTIIAAIGVLVGLVLLSLYGKLGTHLQHFFNHKIPFLFTHKVVPCVRHITKEALDAQVPAWTIPTAFGGTALLLILGFAAKKAYKKSKPNEGVIFN